METTIEKEQAVETKLLIWEDRESINDFESKLRNEITTIQKILNNVNEVFEIKSVDDIPTDPDKYILNVYLEGNKQARELNKVIPVTLANAVLPENLQKLRYVLSAWKSHSNKSAVKYLEKKDDAFAFNEALVKEEVEKFIVQNNRRRYPTDSEEIALTRHWQRYIDDYVKPYAIELNIDHKSKYDTPFTRLKQLFPDKNSLFPYINFEAIQGYVDRKRRNAI